MASHKQIGAKLILQQYWLAARHYPRECTLCLLLPISNVLLFIVVPLLSSHILAALLTNRRNISELFIAVVALTVTGMLCNAIGIRSCMTLTAKVMDDLHKQVFAKLMQRSVSFYNNQIGGKLVSDAQDYVHSFSLLMNAGFIGAFTFILTTLIGLLIIFVSSPLLGLIISVLLAILVVWTIKESRTRAGIRLKRLRISKRQTSHLSDSLVNAVTVKTFASETIENEHAAEISSELRDIRIRDWRRTVTSETYRMSVLMAAQLALIGGLIIITAHNKAALATGIFAFTYTLGLMNRFFTVNTIVRQIDDAMLVSVPMAELLGQEPEIQDSPDAKALVVNKGHIQFNDISFTYDDGNSSDSVFESLNLSIAPGEKVGLIGHSGGGKSTLTRLLLRFDDIQSGTITIDGQDITQVTQQSLRRHIAYVPQEPLLFHRTLKENIAYSETNASLADIRSAASKAYASDFIAKLPHGYQTIVGERGVKLSGGQRQRIAIARAILKNAPILVLDEATSALDSESEKAIQSALWELMKDKTAIVVAHRLSTVQKLDRIIVLSEGSIIEQGSHAELLASGGLYASLWSHQSGGFIED